MFTETQTEFIGSINKLTKKIIENSQSFHSYYIDQKTNYYEETLPLVLHEKKLKNSFNKSEKRLINLCKKNPLSLKSIRHVNIRSKKISDLCPIFNNKGELLPSVVSNSKIYKCNYSYEKNKPKINLGIYPMKRRNLNSFQINNISSSFSNFKKDFFSDEYLKLHYNEEVIFNQHEKYNNIIKEKIEYFKTNKNKNNTTFLEKKYNFGQKNKAMRLSLKSMKINFETPNEEIELYNNVNINKNLQIEFPFSLLPLFYYKGISTFLKLLSACIKIENNFEKVYLDEDSLYIALNHIQEFDNEEFEEKVNIDTIRSINDKIELLTPDFKREKIEPINLRPPILQRNIFFLKYNYFIFFWITNTKVYVTKITLPYISLKIVDNNILINQFIDYELLFFLYQRNFLNWEFYIIKYLSSFTKFRKLFQQLGSLKKINFTKIFLKEPKTKINTFFEEILLNIYTDQFSKNQIIKFKSFYIKVNFIDLHYDCEKVYHIYFTFYQYVKLYQIAKYSSKILFLIKFFDMDNESHTLKFNYEKYDNFDIDVWLDNIQKFSAKSLKNKILEEQLYREFEIYTKKINIEFKKPEWSIIKFENAKEFIKTWEIGHELEIELVESIVNSNSKSWTNLLNECLKKVNEPVPEIQNTLFNLSLKKKSRGNKSLKSNNSSSDTYKKSKNKFLTKNSKK
jgi:hypothetical protein